MITLRNDFLEVKILKLGVTFVSFKSLQDDINIITAYKEHENYKVNDPYLGSLIGPLAGRTKPGSYGLDLDINNPPNHLHGGKNGLNLCMFDVEAKEDEAIFTKLHQDVFYTITVALKDNQVVLDLKATPQKELPINLTNHMYFNLLGENDLKNHTIQLKADKYSSISEAKLNTYDLRDVSNSVFDLRETKEVMDLINRTHPQFEITRHIDHSFKASEVVLNAHHKTLKIKATMPFMHLYFANYFDEGFIDEKGRKAKNHASIAIEPQYLPNDQNMPRYDETHPYHETITYTLSV